MQKQPVNWNAVKDTVKKVAIKRDKRFIKAIHVIDTLEECPRLSCDELKDIPEKTMRTRINLALMDLFHKYGKGSNNGGVYIVPWVEA